MLLCFVCTLHSLKCVGLLRDLRGTAGHMHTRSRTSFCFVFAVFPKARLGLQYWFRLRIAALCKPPWYKLLGLEFMNWCCKIYLQRNSAMQNWWFSAILGPASTQLQTSLIQIFLCFAFLVGSDTSTQNNRATRWERTDQGEGRREGPIFTCRKLLKIRAPLSKRPSPSLTPKFLHRSCKCPILSIF